MLSGGVAGFTVDIASYPINTVYTRIIASTSKDNIHKQIKNNTKSVFSGIQTMLFISVPSGSFYFIGFEFFKKFAISTNIFGKDSIIPSAFGGIGAEICNSLTRTPFEMIKQNIQVGNEKNIIGSLKNIYKRYGLVGFYRGFFAMSFRDIPFSVIQISFYDYLKNKFNNNNNLDPGINGALMGFIAGFTSGALTTPNDIILTKILVDKDNNINTIKKAINYIYSHNGIQGFYKAWYIRGLLIGTGGIFFFSAYEKIKQIILSHNYIN